MCHVIQSTLDQGPNCPPPFPLLFSLLLSHLLISSILHLPAASLLHPPISFPPLFSSTPQSKYMNELCPSLQCHLQLKYVFILCHNCLYTLRVLAQS